MPTATCKAWYFLRNVASKLTRMEHHHQFLTSCYEENIIPVGLFLKTNIGFELYDYMLPKYTADYNSFTFYRIQQLASDALVITKDLLEELTSIEPDIRRRFPLYIANQLLETAAQIEYASTAQDFCAGQQNQKNSRSVR